MDKKPDKDRIHLFLNADDAERQTAGQADDGGEKPPTRLLDVQLPTGLQRQIVKQYLFAALCFIVTSVACAYFREPTILVGFIASGMLIAKGISLTLDYADGKIQELAVICASVNRSITRKSTRIVFRTNDDVPRYFTFHIPGDKRDILPNYAYVIYFDPRCPFALLGYTQL